MILWLLCFSKLGIFSVIMAFLFYTTRRQSQYISANYLYTLFIAYLSFFLCHTEWKKNPFIVFFQSLPNPDMPPSSPLKFCRILSDSRWLELHTAFQASRKFSLFVETFSFSFPFYLVPSILLETHLLFSIAKINETKGNPILLSAI